MADPISNSSLPPNAQGHGLALGRVDGSALEAILDRMLPGVSFEQAVQDAIDAGDLSASDLDPGRLADEVGALSPGHQRQLAGTTEGLPPALREVLDRFGVDRTKADGPGSGADPAGLRDDSTAMPQGNAALRGEQASAAQALARGDAPVPSAVVRASGTIAAQPGAVPVAGDRAQFDGQVLQGARVGEASAAARMDVAGPVLNPERPQGPILQALPQQAVLAPQGRADALPAQILPQAAGATILSAPQGAVVAPNAQAPVARGADGAQARENQLAPAGHTLAGSLRRDTGKRGAGLPRQHPADALLALLPGRRRRRAEGEDTSTSFQWLFWILTVIAYGALAVAIVAMIPSGGGLSDGAGRPGYGAYALVIGALAAAASWWVGRRLSGAAKQAHTRS